MAKVKKLLSIEPGFVHQDKAGHIIACGDGRDLTWLEGVLDGEKPDLALYDPPYNLSGTSARINIEGRKDMFLDENWDKFPDEGKFWHLVLAALARPACTLAPNVWFWTSDWYVSPLKFLLREQGLRVWPTYHWVKLNPPNSFRKANPQSATEYLVMASREGNHFDLKALPKPRNWHAEAAPAWYESGLVTQKERVKRPPGPDGKREDVNRAQKPLALTEALVRAGVAEGGLVLDATGGTGTTLVAADRTGRRAVYVDSDPVQVRAAGRRLREDREARAKGKK